MGQSKECRYNQSTDQLQVGGFQTKPQHHCDNDIIQDCTADNAKHTQCIVIIKSLEYNARNDNGCQTDNDGTTPHVYVCIALILRIQTACKRNQTIGYHKPQNLHCIGIDALCARHFFIIARCTEGTTHFCTEEAIHQRDDYNTENRGNNDCTMDISQAENQIIFIYADCLIGFTQNTHIDRIQTQLGQDTCQNTGDTQSHMEDTCYHACQHTDNRSRYQSNRYIMPGKHHHNCNGAACRNAAVYGHIRKIQYLKGDVNADGKNTPNQPLGDGARKGIEQCHNIHKYTSFYAFFFYRNKRSTCFAYSCI